MKKLLIAVLLICLCVALAACTATDPDNLFEPEPDTTVTSTPGNNDDTTASVPEDTQSNVEDIVYYTGAYQYGNMQKNVPSGNFMLLGNKVLFEHNFDEDLLLYSYDLISEKVKPYCNDATCDHKDCVTGNLLGNIEVYDGRLYGQQLIKSSSNPVMANGNMLEVITSADISAFFHHENKLYMHTADSSLVVLEEGQKEPQMVLEEYTCIWTTVFGNYLYATKLDSSIIRVDLTAETPQEEVLVTNAMGITDGQHIYYVDEKTSHLYRCNMDGSEPQLLVEAEVHLASMNFDDEYFYYRLFTDQQLEGTPDSHDIYRFQKEDPTQIEKIVTLEESAYQVFTVPGTGKIFVTTYAPQGEESPLYVMETDGSNPTKLEIPKY